MKLTQIRLIVSDFPTCFRFYRDVIGLVPQVDDDRGPYAKLSPPQGDAAIALHARDDVAKTLDDLAPAQGDRALIALTVPDVDATVEQIRARGGNVFKGPMDQWGRLRVAYLRDPEGNLIELQQWLAT